MYICLREGDRIIGANSIQCLVRVDSHCSRMLLRAGVTTCGDRHGRKTCQGGACNPKSLHLLFVLQLSTYAAEVHCE